MGGQLLGFVGCFLVPIIAVVIAMIQSQFRVDGTITVGNIFTAVAFLVGGLLAIAAVPRQIKNMGKWIVEHEKWSREQSREFGQSIGKITEILVEIRSQREGDKERLDHLEHRFNSHIENGGHYRGQGGSD